MIIRPILFFIVLFTSYNFYCQSNNENLLIGSWSLYSRNFDGNEIKFVSDSIIISFFKNKSFERHTKNSESKGRWTWTFGVDGKRNYNKFHVILSNKKHRGLEFYNIVIISKDSLILSNEVGTKISYSKYVRHEN